MGLYIINAGEIILIRPIPRWLSGQIMCLQCRRHGFNPWVRKIPWRSKWQSTPVFLPGESYGQRRLAGFSPWGRKSWMRLSTLFTLSIYHKHVHACS